MAQLITFPVNSVAILYASSRRKQPYIFQVCNQHLCRIHKASCPSVKSKVACCVYLFCSLNIKKKNTEKVKKLKSRVTFMHFSHIEVRSHLQTTLSSIFSAKHDVSVERCLRESSTAQMLLNLFDFLLQWSRLSNTRESKLSWTFVLCFSQP